MAGHDIIVIGASAGGIEALKRLARELPPDLDAAIFVVVHIGALKRLPRGSPPDRAGFIFGVPPMGAWGDSILARVPAPSPPLPAAPPADGEPIECGRIYIAPPDQHMLLEPGRIHLARGPKE